MQKNPILALQDNIRLTVLVVDAEILAWTEFVENRTEICRNMVSYLLRIIGPI